MCDRAHNYVIQVPGETGVREITTDRESAVRTLREALGEPGAEVIAEHETGAVSSMGVLVAGWCPEESQDVRADAAYADCYHHHGGRLPCPDQASDAH